MDDFLRPRYESDTDYTTNAPSYYDYLARKNELLKILAKRIWEYDKELAKRFEAWDKNLEDFPEDVKELLNKWIDDGTFAEIINEEIFKSKADQEDVDTLNSIVNNILNEINGLWVNIMEFGAEVGKDSTEAIQAALNTGLNVVIPNIETEDGKGFKTSGVHLTKDNQHILNLGKIHLTDNSYKPIITVENLNNVKVIGGVFDGNAQNNPLDNGQYTLNGEEVSSANTAVILFKNCQDSEIKDVRIEYASAAPIILYKCNQSKISNCVSMNHQREGLGIASGKHCVIENCLSYYDRSKFGLQPWSLISTGGSQGDGGKHYHKIVNNTVINSQAAFITVNTENTEILNNKVIKNLPNTFTNGPGIRIGHADVEDEFGVVISTSNRGYNCIVKNNIVTGLNGDTTFYGGNRGISADNASGTLIEENTITDCLTEGIGVSVTAGQVIDIKNNRIKNCERGIYLLKTNGGFITGNNIKNVKRGIFAQIDKGYINQNVIDSFSEIGIAATWGGGDTLEDVIMEDNIFLNVVENGVNYKVDNTGSYGLKVREIKQGTFTFKGNGNYFVSIPHGLKNTPNLYMAQEGDAVTSTASINFVRAYSSDLQVNFKNPLISGTDYIIHWFAKVE